MSKIWVVAADAGRARFFSAEKSSSGLSEIETFSNPQARLHEGDLVTDRGGRGVSGAAVHSYGSGDETRQESANRFAAEVCRHLEKGRNRRAFGKLYVMAAPQFLGMMRKHQSDGLRGLISNEIASDLTTQSPERIRARLPQYL